MFFSLSLSIIAYASFQVCITRPIYRRPHTQPPLLQTNEDVPT